MAIHLKWHMCHCNEPLVAQIQFAKYFGPAEYIYSYQGTILMYQIRSAITSVLLWIFA